MDRIEGEMYSRPVHQGPVLPWMGKGLEKVGVHARRGITKPRTNISDALQFMRTAQADVHLPMKGVSSPTPPPIRDCLVS